MSKVMILALAAVVVLIPVLLGLLMSPVVAAVRDTFFQRRPKPSGARRASRGLVYEKEGSSGRRRI